MQIITNMKKYLLIIFSVIILLILLFVIFSKNPNALIGNRTSTYLTSWFTGSGVVYTTSNIGVGTSTPTTNLQIVNSTSTPTLAIGSAFTASTTRGKVCIWNGLSFSIISFLTNSTTTTVATSTSCQ